MPRRIAVIGGGITGLAAAHRLRELAPSAEISLFEAGDRLGGVLHTEYADGFLVEHSADMFTTREPWASELCQRIGFANELIGTEEEHRRAFVVRRGRLHAVPAGFTLLAPTRAWPILTTPLLGWMGKLRLACEYFVPARREVADESLAAFATRRFGRQTYEQIIQPLIGGIYTADPQQLSMAATLQQFVEMERTHGGILRATRKAATGKEPPASGARYGMFVAPRRGMSTFVEALAALLPAGTVRLRSSVDAIVKNGGGWMVKAAGVFEPEHFDGVVVCLPAGAAAALLQALDAELATDLLRIPYASTAVAILGYRRDQVAHPLDGFGFVVPHVEGRRVLAGSFASVKFAGRAPQDSVLIRVFVGGALQPELADLPDDELKPLVRQELEELLGTRGSPLFCNVVRWHRAMPQYHVGHLDLVGRIEARVEKLAGLELAGNAYRGVGIPFCIRSGQLAAERVLSGDFDGHTQNAAA